MDDLKKYSEKNLKDIKHFFDEDIEFWYGREFENKAIRDSMRHLE